MKEVSYSLQSLNDDGYGFKINITFHPTMPGKCDFDMVWMADHEETDQYVGVLMEHDDLRRLKDLLYRAISESENRLPEIEDDEIDLSDLFGGDDD